MVDKDIKTVKTSEQYKALFRSGVPDKIKREAILQLYDLNPMACETRYKTILKLAGEDFVTHTKKAQLATKSLEYSFLNEEGTHQLEIMLALLFKERQIKHSPMMVQVASLLLIFLKPSEVYHVLIALVNTS